MRRSLAATLARTGCLGILGGLGLLGGALQAPPLATAALPGLKLSLLSQVLPLQELPGMASQEIARQLASCISLAHHWRLGCSSVHRGSAVGNECAHFSFSA